jgi:hypothetical protein
MRQCHHAAAARALAGRTAAAVAAAISCTTAAASIAATAAAAAAAGCCCPQHCGCTCEAVQVGGAANAAQLPCSARKTAAVHNCLVSRIDQERIP